MAYSGGTLFYPSAPISPTTAAVTAKAPISTEKCSLITIVADNLAGAEEVDIFLWINGGWETAKDSSGNALTLTATIPMRTFVAGPRYGVTKDATAGACGVFVQRDRD